MAKTEVLIIGCGIAGATAALRLARNPNRQITILTRAADTHESNTRYAQGGIIGRGPNDSAELLFEDIIAAGAGVSSPEVARILANEGPPLLNEVLQQTAGVVFDHDASGAPVWGQEAAHSRRRILHVGDATGLAIINGLISTLGDYPNINIKSEATAVDLITFPHHSRDPLDNYRAVSCHGCYIFDREESTVHRYLAIINGLISTLDDYPNINIKSEATAVDLITFPHHSRDPLDNYRAVSCHGCYIFDREESTVHRYLAQATILATGGLGRIYRNTTNPVGARGDG